MIDYLIKIEMGGLKERGAVYFKLRTGIVTNCHSTTRKQTIGPEAEEYKYIYRKSSIKPPGGLFFSSTFEGGGGLKREGGLFNLAKRITCSKNTVV